MTRAAVVKGGTRTRVAEAPGDVARLPLLAQAESALHCLFQPIVDVQTGVVQGVEARMGGFEKLGFASAPSVMEYFVQAGAVDALEELLSRKAIKAFAALALPVHAGEIRLFLTMDARSLADASETVMERTTRLVAGEGLPLSSLCVELSEQYEQFSASAIQQSIQRLRRLGVRFAVDDFGQGYSELKLMFDQAVDYIKVDRYFVADIDTSHRKKLFLANVCRFAHVLGARVIANSIETEAEFEACRSLGCDLAQGAWIAPPQRVPEPLYAHVATAAAKARNLRASEATGAEAIAAVMVVLPTVRFDAPVDRVIDLFREQPELELCLALDAAGEPMGTIRQAQLRPLIYQRYGRDLLKNESYRVPLRQFLNPCPSISLDWTINQVLDVFMAHSDAQGVVVTAGGKYRGFLTAEALLKLANERYLTEALDRNPLTRLPGNTVVASRIAAILADTRQPRPARYLCYFDFDNFKPFNDYKGFRQGDRAITLFAEAIQRRFAGDPDSFFGHLGGDDFVGIVEGYAAETVRSMLEEGLGEFAATVAGMYTDEERARGWIEALDRFGAMRRFPLLRCSVAVVEFVREGGPVSASDFDGLIARLKGEAKASAEGISWRRLAPAERA